MSASCCCFRDVVLPQAAGALPGQPPAPQQHRIPSERLQRVRLRAATRWRGWPLLIQRRHPGVRDAWVRRGRVLLDFVAAIRRPRSARCGWRQRVNQLGHHHKVPPQHQDGSRIVSSTAVVGGTTDKGGEEGATGEGGERCTGGAVSRSLR